MISRLGKLSAEEPSKEREARAARERLFSRICAEAEATLTTFEQAAHRLGVSRAVQEYFQSEPQISKAATETLEVDKSEQGSKVTKRSVRQFLAHPQHWLSNWRFGLQSISLLIIFLALLGLAVFFRYDIRTTGSGLFVARLDRLTGNIEWCYPNRGCSQYIAR